MHGRILRVGAATVAALTLAAAPAAAKQVSVTIADTGKTITVTRGDTVKVSLDSNVSTPFRWVVTQKPKRAIARVTQDRYVAPAEVLPGAGGTQVYVIRATGKGQTRFQTQYQSITTGRPGDGATTFAVRIRVR
jgi:inhibitor of cysteine peptidase